jgi:hypothetical protein
MGSGLTETLPGTFDAADHFVRASSQLHGLIRPTCILISTAFRGKMKRQSVRH